MQIAWWAGPQPLYLSSLSDFALKKLGLPASGGIELPSQPSILATFSPSGRQEPPVSDDPGATRSSDGAVPLDKPQALSPRAVPTADFPRRPAIRLRPQRRAAHTWQRRAVAGGRGDRARDQGAADWWGGEGAQGVEVVAAAAAGRRRWRGCQRGLWRWLANMPGTRARGWGIGRGWRRSCRSRVKPRASSAACDHENLNHGSFSTWFVRC